MDRLDRPLDPARDHILGRTSSPLVLLEYGSYGCPSCHTAHEVVHTLRERFADRLAYAYRHHPKSDPLAWRAAELAEIVSEETGEFWRIHDALMRVGPRLAPEDLERIAEQFGVSAAGGAVRARARRRVEADALSARRSGARITPTFFVRERKYEGPWDESTLAQALIRAPSQRLHTASVAFARWGPSTGVLLLVAFVVALGAANSPLGDVFERWWETPIGLSAGDRAFALSVRGWINDALLAVFFLVVGLEIKRELTVGRLSTPRAAALPVAAAIGGMVAPALLYLLVAPSGPASRGWGVPIATDTAFAIAVLVLLGRRVPVELRVFLTAAVIVDDLVVIAVVAVFYTSGVSLPYAAAAVATAAALVALNRFAVYRSLPYTALGIVLWATLHEAGIHATLAGVILAVTTPVRPPPHLPALLAQADAIIEEEMSRDADTVLRRGLSDEARRALDVVHDRIESPADRLLRAVEPWSSYLVLPVFALANAGVAVSWALARDNAQLILAIGLGLVVGKPVGILAASALAAWSGLAEKPDAYSWVQLAGAAAVAGIGFTMSLFIASQAFPDPDTFAAAKIGIFLASLLAGGLGVLLLRTRPV